MRAFPSRFGAPRYWGSGHKQASSICIQTLLEWRLRWCGDHRPSGCSHGCLTCPRRQFSRHPQGPQVSLVDHGPNRSPDPQQCPRPHTNSLPFLSTGARLSITVARPVQRQFVLSLRSPDPQTKWLPFFSRSPVVGHGCLTLPGTSWAPTTNDSPPRTSWRSSIEDEVENFVEWIKRSTAKIKGMIDNLEVLDWVELQRQRKLTFAGSIQSRSFKNQVCLPSAHSTLHHGSMQSPRTSMSRVSTASLSIIEPPGTTQHVELCNS